MKRVKFATVYETSNYEEFKALGGNRQLNKGHLSRLRKSIAQHYLFSPILVNENMEIIDGQHRFTICQELELPVRFIEVDGYGLEEVQILNANSHDWSIKEYLDSYVRHGMPEYIKLNDFYNEFKHYGLSVCRALLDGHFGNSHDTEKFKRGDYKCGSTKQARDWAIKLGTIKPHYEKYLVKAFVTAMLHLFKHAEYNHSEFVAKLQYQSTSLIDCRTSDQYLVVIEDIYNYRRRDKVSLKYLPTLKKAS